MQNELGFNARDEAANLRVEEQTYRELQSRTGAKFLPQVRRAPLRRLNAGAQHVSRG
jgi:hypothetical protein